MLATVQGVLLMVAVAETALLMSMPATSARIYLLGFVHAALAVGAGWMIHLLFLGSRRDAIHQLRGAWGEDNTTDVLRWARRRRRIWAWVDAIAVDGGDIDHLVATRRGGLVAIDSKWRSTMEDPQLLARSAQRAARRAAGLVGSVTVRSRGRRRGGAGDLVVTPLVVVWGPAQTRLEQHPVVDGVTVLPGCDLAAWLASLDGAPMERGLARELIDRLRAYDETRERLIGSSPKAAVPSAR